MKSSLFLAVAIVFEVIGSTMLVLSNGWTVLWPSLGSGVGFLISFTFLAMALKEIPLSTAYAIWAGVGTALNVCVGILLFGESISVLKVVALLIVVAGLVILNKSKGNAPQAEAQTAGAE